MDSGEEKVQKEIRALIDVSCRFNKRPNEQFCAFHKAYLKFCFNAVDVEINYENQQIYSSNSKPLTTNPVRLFDMNKAVADQLSYSDLKETLTGCLNDSHLHYLFYRKMLLEYGDFSKDELDNLCA
ncbi:hypothetical protein [Aequorivita capsosiphonis]|uniref:hypothetical protein n=1 Tax=Aequorivita capsosiphonis TaxID=487317 RepID=UPI00047E775F|nr:hypothetical protein [Aequorivita capsosiphonis]